MPTTFTPHPSERDLINVARDEIGAKKKERIFAHCRECATCADRLIELTREHAPDPGPIKLTRWHKFSIALFVVTLIAVVVGMVWFLRTLPGPQPFGPPPPLEEPDSSAPGQEDP